MTEEILSGNFSDNSDVINSDIQRLYSEIGDDYINLYFTFSANPIYSVTVSYDDVHTEYTSHQMYRLTNSANISNLYALCMTINKACNSDREINITFKIQSDQYDRVSKTSRFSITQEKNNS